MTSTLYVNDSQWNKYRNVKIASLYLSHRDVSTDIQHDLPGPILYLGLRSKFDVDCNVTTYMLQSVSTTKTMAPKLLT